ncbi:protein sprouty homolog 2-like [Montipora capricornis]|uniref:protein sprouty homolog 2-like n=1 Tax=Montipora capricornis TaxID=246305 RepID=UPI0035F12738
MAVETAVVLHENPLEKTLIWEKRSVQYDSKHRIRPQNKLSKVDTIVISNKDEYNADYCVIAAATKKVATPRQPVLVADRNAGLRLSSPATDRTFNAFVRRHTGGTYSQVVINSQPRPTASGLAYSPTTRRSTVLQSKHHEDDDIKLFCCKRSVDVLIDYASCMCGVKAVLYHCSKDSFDEGNVLEQPCSCGPPRKPCLGRWGCLAACSVFLPCLLCYLPLKGCSEVCVCYKRQKITSRQRQRRPRDPA